MAEDSDRARDALAGYVTDPTLELVAADAAALPGTIPVQLGCLPWTAHADGSIEAVVAVAAPDLDADPIRCLLEARRVLREGGRLALGFRSHGAQRCYSHLLHRLGGFVIDRAEPIAPARFLLAATRSVVAEVQAPLGLLGPELAAAARRDRRARGELLFQSGMIVAQGGAPEVGVELLRAFLALEPGSPDGLFGLGVVLGGAGRWSEALTELQRAYALDPGNVQVQQWLREARSRIRDTARMQPV
jgi:hypothetical protein